jgi:hypothetical protein
MRNPDACVVGVQIPNTLSCHGISSNAGSDSMADDTVAVDEVAAPISAFVVVNSRSRVRPAATSMICIHSYDLP